MFKSVVREISLAFQARNGVSGAVLLWAAIFVAAALSAFVFLCISGYGWLALRYDRVIAGLIMAGLFAAIAIIAAIVAAVIRRRIRQRAILEQAARRNTPPAWLLDPKFLSAAVETGRTLGWQRLVPIAIVGFLAAQWARERRDRADKRS